MNLKSTLADATGPTLSQTSAAKAHSTVERLSSGAHHAVDAMQSVVDKIEPEGRRWVSSTRSYVRGHPFKSLGIALAAGMVVRQMVRR